MLHGADISSKKLIGSVSFSFHFPSIFPLRYFAVAAADCPDVVSTLNQHDSLDFTCEKGTAGGTSLYLGNSNANICENNSVEMTSLVEEQEHAVQCESGKWQYLTCKDAGYEDGCNEATLTPTCELFADMLNSLLDSLPTLPIRRAMQRLLWHCGNRLFDRRLCAWV